MQAHKLIAISAAILLAACASSDAPPPAQAAAPSNAPVATAAPAAPAASTARTEIVTSADGSKSWTVVIDGDRVELRIGGGDTFVGELNKDKRRYRRASNGEAFVEVKDGDEGFKVRTPDSKLLWKVKFGDGKIKVSDNEENLQPWVLKTKYEDKAKILDPAETEIGEVKYYLDQSKIKVKDAAGAELYSVDTSKRSAAYGVLAMSAIPDEYRALVMAEILVRGR